MKKFIFVLILSFMLLVIVLLCVQLFNINQQYNNLQSYLTKKGENIEDTLSNSNHISVADLSSIENDITEMKNNSNELIYKLKEDIDNLKQQYTQFLDNNQKVNNYENKIDSLDNNINTLDNKINTIEKEIDLLNNNISSDKKEESNFPNTSNESVNNEIIGKWSTTITDTIYSPDTHKENQETYVTLYEFKENGDFYINENKIGTYNNNDILLKDSNDYQYRMAHYYYIDNNLYVNLYYNNKNISISTYFYKCDK